MVSFLAILVLAVFLSLGCGASLPNSEHSVLANFRGLSKEALDEIFIAQDIREYFQFLSQSDAAPELRASINAEKEIIKKAAEEMENLQFNKEEDYQQFDSLAAAVRLVVRLHWDSRLDYITAAGEIVPSGIQRYNECSAFSKTGQWKRTCMAALIQDHFCHFDSKTITDNLEVMVSAAVSIGDWDIFFALFIMLQPQQRADFLITIAEAIGYYGSAEFFDSVSFLYEEHSWKLVLHMLRPVVGFRRQELQSHLLELVSSLPEKKQTKILGPFYRVACLFGRGSLFQALYEQYPLSQVHALVALEAAAKGKQLNVFEQVLSLIEQPGETKGLYHLPRTVIYDCFLNAANNNDLSMMKFLISKYQRDYRCMFAFFWSAAGVRNVEIVNLLLGQYEDHQYYLPVVTQDIFSTAMSVLASAYRWDLIRCFTDGLDKDDRFDGLTLPDDTLPFNQECSTRIDVNSLFQEACKVGHLDCVKFLLRKDENGHFAVPGIDPAANESMAVYEACKHGHLLIVMLLFMHEAVDPATMNNGPIRVAAQYKHWDIVRFLLLDTFKYGGRTYRVRGRGIDPAVEDNELLRYAAYYNKKDVILLLLRRDANGNQVYPGVVIPKDVQYITCGWTPKDRKLQEDIISWALSEAMESLFEAETCKPEKGNEHDQVQ